MSDKSYKVSTYEITPLKSYHVRYYKILSILKYYQKYKIPYNQTKILKNLNLFLIKDNFKQITIRTLREDLRFLCENGIINKTLLRLGEKKGSYIRYTVIKYSSNNLKRLLENKQKIIEHDANTAYFFTKKTQKRYYKNKKRNKKNFKGKNVTKNVSQYINNNKYIKNKEKNNNIESITKDISKKKNLNYLFKIKDNSIKKKYEENMNKAKEYFKHIEFDKIKSK